MTLSLLRKEKTGLIIVDAQEKLMNVMKNRERVVDRMVKLLHLARVFDLPVILTEQNSKMLGPTVSAVKELLPEYRPLEKIHFNCCEVEDFNRALDSGDFNNFILTGIETHICVFQTCLSLLEKGYNVHVPHHAVDSRTEGNWNIGLSLMQRAGAVITSAETIIFQIIGKAGTKEFKKLLPVIK